MESKKENRPTVNEQFHRLFETEYAGLLRYASATLKVRSGGTPVNGKAEVAVQEMFVFAWENREEVLASEQPVGWLYKALYYKVLEILRDENKWKKNLLRYQQNYLPPAESHISLETELAGIISKEEFELLWHIYVEGYSYKELCHKMGLTKSNLAVRIHRIKTKIKKHLDQEK